MGHVVNVSKRCKVCGARVSTDEEYCEKHKDYEEMDVEEKEEIDADVGDDSLI